MRLTISINDDLVADILQISEYKTKTKAINMALNEWLRVKKMQKIKSLRGKLNIQNNIKELRDLEKKEIEVLNG